MSQRAVRWKDPSLAATGPGSKAGDAELHEIDLSPGHLFTGRFEVIRSIGSGGSSVVYQAFDLQTQQMVALKVMHKALVHDADYHTLFACEAHILRSRELDHPNIPRLVAAGRSGGRAYNAQEYLEGISLRYWINAQRTQPSLREVADIFLRLCPGPALLHRLNLVHCDIKAENFMVSGARVWLVDYGSVRWNGTRCDGKLVGTAYSMSPNQWQGCDTDTRDDIYSLAVTVFEMLALRHPLRGVGVHPFLKQGVAEFMRVNRQRYDGKKNLLIPLNELRPDLPAEVVEIVMRGLAARPEDRPAQVTDFMKVFAQHASKPVRDANFLELATLLLNPAHPPAPLPARPTMAPATPTEPTHVGHPWRRLPVAFVSLVLIGFLAGVLMRYLAP